jgi:hypothetical protein
VPYIAVDEAHRALALDSHADRLLSIKSFDYLLTVGAAIPALVVDVKARRFDAVRESLQNWVTRDDIEGLRRWKSLLGPGVDAAFVFVYWMDAQPPDIWFEDTLRSQGRWYGFTAVFLDDYIRCMRPRSRRWATVHLPTRQFASLRRPLPQIPRSCGHAPTVLC